MLCMDKKIILEWIKKAEDDELNIKSILKHRDGTPSLVCFVSQQMSEKYLKSLLIFYANDCPKIHSLKELSERIAKYSPDIFSKTGEHVILLDPYYIETRYPSDVSSELFTWEMAEDAYKSAMKIKEFVLEKINSEE